MLTLVQSCVCTIHRINVGLLLVQRRRRWDNSEPTLIQRLVFAERLEYDRSTDIQVSVKQMSLPRPLVKILCKLSIKKMTAIASFSVARKNGQCQQTCGPRIPIYTRFEKNSEKNIT